MRDFEAMFKRCIGGRKLDKSIYLRRSMPSRTRSVRQHGESWGFEICNNHDVNTGRKYFKCHRHEDDRALRGTVAAGSWNNSAVKLVEPLTAWTLIQALSKFDYPILEISQRCRRPQVSLRWLTGNSLSCILDTAQPWLIMVHHKMQMISE